MSAIGLDRRSRAVPVAGSHRSPFSGRPLPPGEAHIWQAALDGPASCAVWRFARGLLAPDEMERAGRCFFEKDRRRFVVSRGILRLILGGYLDVNPRDLVFAYGPGGKPSLVAPAGRGALYFNVSHSAARVLCVCTRVGEAGIDVERVRTIREWEQIAAACFPRAENELLRSLPREQCTEEFFRLWTRHEALLKAAGDGLKGAGPPPGRVSPEDRTHAVPFLVHALQPGRGYVASLAIGRAADRITCRVWPEEDFAVEAGGRPAVRPQPEDHFL